MCYNLDLLNFDQNINKEKDKCVVTFTLRPLIFANPTPDVIAESPKRGHNGKEHKKTAKEDHTDKLKKKRRSAKEKKPEDENKKTAATAGPLMSTILHGVQGFRGSGVQGFRGSGFRVQGFKVE